MRESFSHHEWDDSSMFYSDSVGLLYVWSTCWYVYSHLRFAQLFHCYVIVLKFSDTWKLNPTPMHLKTSYSKYRTVIFSLSETLLLSIGKTSSCSLIMSRTTYNPSMVKTFLCLSSLFVYLTKYLLVLLVRITQISKPYKGCTGWKRSSVHLQ